MCKKLKIYKMDQLRGEYGSRHMFCKTAWIYIKPTITPAGGSETGPIVLIIFYVLQWWSDVTNSLIGSTRIKSDELNFDLIEDITQRFLTLLRLKSHSFKLGPCDLPRPFSWRRLALRPVWHTFSFFFSPILFFASFVSTVVGFCSNWSLSVQCHSPPASPKTSFSSRALCQSRSSSGLRK